MGRGSGSGLGRDGPTRRIVRTGAALLLGSVAVALLLARHYHQDVANTLVPAILGVPGLFFTWLRPARSCDATNKRAFRRGEPLKEFQTADSVRLAVSTTSKDGWAEITHSVVRLLDLSSH